MEIKFKIEKAYLFVIKYALLCVIKKDIKNGRNSPAVYF
jgi:hypothetical protein